MADRDNGDRAALIALGMALIAVVVVIWLEQPSVNFAFAGEGESLQGASVSDFDRVVAALNDYNPWEDSFAQWAMAGISAVGTAVSIWAVILLRDTLRATREAVRSSDDAVKAAEAAVNASERFGKIQSRAYVSIADINTDPDQSGGFTEDNFVGVIRLSNTGNTPAYNVQAKVELLDEGAEPCFPKFSKVDAGVLGPGVALQITTPSISLADFWDEDAFVLRFVVYFSYSDIFGVQHQSWSQYRGTTWAKCPVFQHVSSWSSGQ
ncbi:MAG: hypothetical protein ACK4NV_13655 [Pannonibacter sp.]